MQDPKTQRTVVEGGAKERLAAFTQKLGMKRDPAKGQAFPPATSTIDMMDVTRVEQVPAKQPAVDLAKPEPLRLTDVLPSPYQPRKRPLTKKDVAELMTSIESAGQVTPIIVSPAPDQPGKYHVHSGHRRCASLRYLGAATVQAVVRPDLDERAARRIAVADNIGREDLTAYEQALALREFAAAFSVSVEDAAQELGVGRRTGYRLSAILDASEEMQMLIRDHAISAKASEVLVRLEGAAGKRPALQAARRLAAGALSLDGLEALARESGKKREPRATRDIELRRDGKTATLKVHVTFDVLGDGQRQRIAQAVGEFLGAIGVPRVEAVVAKEVPAGHAE